MGNNRKPSILIVDDDESIQTLLKTRASTLGFDTRCEGSGAGMREALTEEDFHAVLLDLRLPDGDGLDFINEIHDSAPDLPVIIITGHGDVNHAVEAMRSGAYDFLQKPIDLNRLTVSLKNAIERFALKQKISTYEKIHRSGLGELIGGSSAMQVVYRIIETVAPTKVPVFIYGESGTGKELAAKALHALSPRKDRELIDVNCSAIPKDLMESALFGHEPHAFTGANERFIGYCERANQSTLFLDEIAEMDINLQAKLLRFLQDFTFYRVGGREKIKSDVRVIAATNREPMQAIRDGQLREDLFYRLNVVPLHMPALRRHPEDIPELAECFLQKYSLEIERNFTGFTEAVMDALCAYPWNGNIRELENTIRQIVALNPNGGTVSEKLLPDAIRLQDLETEAPAPVRTPRGPEAMDGIQPIEVIERQAIEKALRLTRGNVGKASAALHLSQATLYRKLRDYGLVLENFKD